MMKMPHRIHFVAPGPTVPMHPCLTCGACCAHFRVGFHWSESDQHAADGVPSELTEILDGHRLVMKGTWARQPRCVALDAEIGVYSRCSIHPQRPSVCRDVPASWEFGIASAQCDKGRIAHGLPVLTPQSWDYLKIAPGADADADADRGHDNPPDLPTRARIPHVLLASASPITVDANVDLASAAPVRLEAVSPAAMDGGPGTDGSSAADPLLHPPAHSGPHPDNG